MGTQAGEMVASFFILALVVLSIIIIKSIEWIVLGAVAVVAMVMVYKMAMFVFVWALTRQDDTVQSSPPPPAITNNYYYTTNNVLYVQPEDFIDVDEEWHQIQGERKALTHR